MTACWRPESCSATRRQAVTLAAAEIPGALLLLFQDNEAALANTLAGSACDPDSRALVAAIWHTAARAGLALWVERAESKANPADCFSRPQDVALQPLREQLTRLFDLTSVPCPWPPRLDPVNLTAHVCGQE